VEEVAETDAHNLDQANEPDVKSESQQSLLNLKNVEDDEEKRDEMEPHQFSTLSQEPGKVETVAEPELEEPSQADEPTEVKAMELIPFEEIAVDEKPEQSQGFKAEYESPKHESEKPQSKESGSKRSVFNEDKDRSLFNDSRDKKK